MEHVDHEGEFRLLKQSVPFLLTAVALLMDITPTIMSKVVGPHYVPIVLFYWTLYRPNLIILPAVMVIGFLADILGGGVFGLTALQLLVLHGFMLLNREFFLKQLFPTRWLGFAVVMFILQILAFLVTYLTGTLSWVGGQVIWQYAFQWALTCAFFPLVTYLCYRCHLKWVV